ncbi:MAG TPA: L-threonylcarbamoyladenylate synthase [Microthrixaceae bacterium]|nr:L-threonylcarbamoyladenylate synthase [Microthrixaceae bacterium]
MSDLDQPNRESEVIPVDPADPDPGAIERAALTLRAGGLVAFPTETVYGLGANALDPEAISAVFRAKGRPATDPLIVHVSSIEMAKELTSQWPATANAFAEAFWPGPLTLVLPKSPDISDAITAGRPSVALRVPSHPVAHALIVAAGVPVAAPSANRFGRISPTRAAHVVDELDGTYELLLDAGPTMVGVESSVVDLSGESPALLRPGGVTLEQLLAVVPEVDYAERKSSDEDVDAVAPGQFLRHYAPSTPLVLVDGGSALVKELQTSVTKQGIRVDVLALPEDPQVAARDLYRLLRSADKGEASLLLAQVQSDSGMGRAVNDRLFRASHGRVLRNSDPDTVSALAQLAL